MFAAKHSATALFTRSTIRGQPIFMKAVRRQQCMPTFAKIGAMRAFSTENISSGATKLTRALEKEIKYENENYTQLEDIETFLNESGFAFTEDDEGMSMSLKKKIGDKNIEIVFDARYFYLKDLL